MVLEWLLETLLRVLVLELRLMMLLQKKNLDYQMNLTSNRELHTYATNTCIFPMPTVVIANAIMRAWQQSALTATTSNIVQKDWSTSLSKAGTRAGCSTWWVRMREVGNAKITGQFNNIYNLPLVRYPSCLQTTWASLLSHESSQTVPHCSPKHISTLPAPELTFLPWTSLRSPLLQTPIL